MKPFKCLIYFSFILFILFYSSVELGHVFIILLHFHNLATAGLFEGWPSIIKVTEFKLISHFNVQNYPLRKEKGGLIHEEMVPFRMPKSASEKEMLIG